MAKRNYGTISKKVADLVDDLTSKDPRGFYHNMVNSADLFAVLDAVLERMPRDERQAAILYKWACHQTIGTSMKIEELFGLSVKGVIMAAITKGQEIYKEEPDASKKS